MSSNAEGSAPFVEIGEAKRKQRLEREREPPKKTQKMSTTGQNKVAGTNKDQPELERLNALAWEDNAPLREKQERKEAKAAEKHRQVVGRKERKAHPNFNPYGDLANRTSQDGAEGGLRSEQSSDDETDTALGGALTELKSDDTVPSDVGLAAGRFLL